MMSLKFKKNGHAESCPDRFSSYFSRSPAGHGLDESNDFHAEAFIGASYNSCIGDAAVCINHELNIDAPFHTLCNSCFRIFQVLGNP